jgi:hypothetical protein
MTDEERKNYERSYESMWREIGNARAQRSRAIVTVDAAIDLVISMQHDMGDGTTKVTLRTMDAINALRAKLREYDDTGRCP